MPPPNEAAPKPRWAGWIAFGIVGLIATGAGTFVPGLAPSEEAGAAAVSAEAVSAEAASDYTPPAVPDLPSPRAMLLRLALGTVVVLALCVATLFVIKRWFGPFAPTQTGGRELFVLETLQLNGRCSVFLLQAGKTRAIAGVDATGLKVLMALPEPFEMSLAEVGGAEDPPAGSAFPRAV
jgi:flagellar biogenesis protein FliO